jgi:hypothetical protein
MRLHHHLKHWLVPHRHNNHYPHLIRAHGLAVVAILIVGIQTTAVLARPAAQRANVSGSVLAYASGSITPVGLLTQTNQQRAANGLAALRLDARLNNSATMKAQNMFAEDYWAHVSPSGIQPWYWFTQAGYTYRYAGENLAKDFDTTSGVMAGWMASAGHRANILNANYTDVGFAVMNGTLVGGQTTLVVAHYGQPTVIAAAPAPVAPTAPKATPAVKSAATAPQATPVRTAVATPAPTPVPATATPTVVSTPPIATGTVTESTPAPTQYTFWRPLSLTSTLSWAMLATLALLGMLLSVYLASHLAAWRRRLPRWHSPAYRGLAAAQVSGLAAIMIYLASSGFGRVG